MVSLLQEELCNCKEELEHTRSENEQLQNRLAIIDGQLHQVKRERERERQCIHLQYYDSNKKILRYY